MNITKEMKFRGRARAAEDLLRETVDDMYRKIETGKTSFDDMCEVHGDLADRMDELGIIHAVELEEVRKEYLAATGLEDLVSGESNV